MPKFIELFTTENSKVLTNLGTFVQKAFELRNEIVLT